MPNRFTLPILEKAAERIVIAAGRAIRGAFYRRHEWVEAGQASTDAAAEIDLEAEEIILQSLEELNIPMAVLSEEAGWVSFHEGDAERDLIAIVDPLDGTHLWEAGIPLCSVALAFLLPRSHQPLVAAVYDVFGEILHMATGQRRSWMRLPDGRERPFRTSDCQTLDGGRVVQYSLSAERMRHLSISSLSSLPVSQWLTVPGGNLALCSVAKGDSLAVLETAKGFLPWDRIAGSYIVKRAGGTVCKLDGTPLSFDPFTGRERFIAAANDQILGELAPHYQKQEKAAA